MDDNTATATSSRARPEEKHRLGTLEAAIWKNEGAHGTFRAVTFRRSYKDAEGEWRSTDSFRQKDLVFLSKLADKAHSRIETIQENERSVEQTR